VTYALLKSDFGLDLEVPIDQLCPPVPNRANYIYWLRDLLHNNSPQLLTSSSPLRGIDMYAPMRVGPQILSLSSRMGWGFCVCACVRVCARVRVCACVLA
jgi:23S rRNA (adenine1618-N6)-methyltransferase